MPTFGNDCSDPNYATYGESWFYQNPCRGAYGGSLSQLYPYDTNAPDPPPYSSPASPAPELLALGQSRTRSGGVCTCSGTLIMDDFTSQDPSQDTTRYEVRSLNYAAFYVNNPNGYCPGPPDAPTHWVPSIGGSYDSWTISLPGQPLYTVNEAPLYRCDPHTHFQDEIRTPCGFLVAVSKCVFLFADTPMGGDRRTHYQVDQAFSPFIPYYRIRHLFAIGDPSAIGCTGAPNACTQPGGIGIFQHRTQELVMGWGTRQMFVDPKGPRIARDFRTGGAVFDLTTGVNITTSNPVAPASISWVTGNALEFVGGRQAAAADFPAGTTNPDTTLFVPGIVQSGDNGKTYRWDSALAASGHHPLGSKGQGAYHTMRATRDGRGRAILVGWRGKRTNPTSPFATDDQKGLPLYMRVAHPGPGNDGRYAWGAEQRIVLPGPAAGQPGAAQPKCCVWDLKPREDGAILLLYPDYDGHAYLVHGRSLPAEPLDTGSDPTTRNAWDARFPLPTLSGTGAYGDARVTYDRGPRLVVVALVLASTTATSGTLKAFVGQIDSHGTVTWNSTPGDMGTAGASAGIPTPAGGFDVWAGPDGRLHLYRGGTDYYTCDKLDATAHGTWTKRTLTL